MVACHAGDGRLWMFPWLGAGVLQSPQATIIEVALNSTWSENVRAQAAFRRTRPVQPCSTDSEPDASCEFARAKIAKIEKALEVMESARGLLSRR